MLFQKYFSNLLIIILFLCYYNNNLVTINSKFLNNLYHSSQEIFQELDLLASTSCSSIMTRGTVSNSNQDIVYYTISSITPSTPNINKKKAVMIFGEHSRELITPEQALFLINVLCKVEKIYDSDTVNKILNDVEFVIVPIVNVYGRGLVQNGDFCERTNENGVDLNRNWDSHWQYAAEHNAQFPGEAPFSEWQTRALRDLLGKIEPEIFITTHAGTLGMYTPFAYKKFKYTDLSTEDSKKLSTMLKIIKKVNSKYCNCKAGSIGNDLWYLCPGTCLDYAYEKLQIKYSFAFEIYDGITTNENFLKIINDPNLKTFNYSEFRDEIKFDLEFITFKSFLQTGITTKVGFLKNKNNALEAINEKLSYHKDLNFKDSCFAQMEIKNTSQESCNKQMNPLTELHYRNTLINWVNVYFETFALIIEYDAKDIK